MKKSVLILLSCLMCYDVCAQIVSDPAHGIIRGRVTDDLSNEGLNRVTVSIITLQQETATDSTGNYVLKNIPPGVHHIQFSYLGYTSQRIFDIQVGNARVVILDVALERASKTLGEVRIHAPTLAKTIESPLSLHTIGSTEIKRNPGGNRDISKVIQSFPGVGTSVSFRNDIIIRGGAPNENRFYIDGIEIPNINHFVTQGSSGGPVGLINVDFIREVDFYGGAFPANRGNTLSSVFEFKQRDGRDDRFLHSITMGSSDFAAAIEGPIGTGTGTTMIASYRYSYLQGLFKLLGLPFLPSYQDFQFKIKKKHGTKHEITALGLGALDDFRLNLAANNTLLNNYIVSNIPINGQRNYTIGVNYKNYRKEGYSTLVLSRNYLYSTAYKYQDNDSDKTKILDYSSQEIENKFRFENTSRTGLYKINYGAGIETAHYGTNTVNILPFGTKKYVSNLDLSKYSLFAQFSRNFQQDKLGISFGLRADANTYSNKMNDLARTLSPRFSSTYQLSNKLSLNFNTGIYYQLPAYTLLGYKETTDGPFLNKEVDYIRSKQAVLGLAYDTPQNTRFTVEGFYKLYDQYPIVRIFDNDIPLADLGSDFGVVGNSLLAGFSEGRSYGLEFLAQQKLNKGFYGILALTLFKSEFQDNNKHYTPSSWDSRYILSMTGGKVFKKNWELGLKIRFTGGNPYTPYDLAASSLKTNYNIYPQGIPDFNQLNQNRLGNFYQVDIRVDKKYPFRNFSFNMYLDIQNLTSRQYALPAILVLDHTTTGTPQDNSNDSNRFKTKLIDNIIGNMIPTLGFIFEF